jgi:cytochrome c1
MKCLAIGCIRSVRFSAPVIPLFEKPITGALKRTLQAMAFAALIVATIGCNQEKIQKAEEMTGGDVKKGKYAIESYGCVSCHTIPGVRDDDAVVGPPLDRMGSRVYIGGVMKNTPNNMIRWVQNPPGVDPMTAMPNLHVTESDARDIASYLYTLR